MLKNIDDKYSESIENILLLDSEFQLEYDELKDFYDDDKIPLTILFGQIGEVAARKFNVFSDELKLNFFGLIESLMCSDDDYLATAIATGFGEAFALELIQNSPKGSWDIALPYLGKETRKHIITWLEN